jgi:PAS domain S-box-containing protein
MLNVSLRIKNLIILLTVGVLFTGLNYAIQRLVVFPSFVEIERNEAKKDMEQCVAAFSKEIHQLDALTHDWAARDETYQFVEDRNKEHIKANLLSGTFKNNNCNLICIYNTKGELVMGNIDDQNDKGKTQWYDSFLHVLSAEHPLLMHINFQSFHAGVLMTEHGPMLIASRPIITSNEMGPIRGTLIMGRFLDADLIKTLSEQAPVRFQVWTVKDETIPTDERDIINQVTNSTSFLIRASSNKLLRAYTLIPDIQGTPALLIRAEIPRDIVAKETTAIWFTILSTIFAWVIIAFLMWSVLKRTVFDPISDLITQLTAFGKVDDLSERLSAQQGDDIGYLAQEFQSMVKQLFTTRMQLQELRQDLANANKALEAEITRRKQTEEVLESEELRSIVETANDAIFTINGKGMIVSWNQKAEEIYGYPEDEAIGKPYSSMIPERFREAHQETANFNFPDGESVAIGKTIEGIGLKKDDSEFPLEVSFTKWTINEEPFFTAVIHVITEYKQVEKEVKERWDFLENTFLSSPDGIMISNSKGYVVSVNRAVEEMIGFTREELVGKHTAELIPQDEKQGIIGDILTTDLIEKGFVKNFETAWLKKDGSVCPIEISVTYLWNNEGNKAGAISIIREISERKKSEEEVRKTRDFLESVIDNCKDGIVICDAKGYILSVNAAMERMSSFRKEELIGEHASILTIDDRDIKKKILEKTGDLFEKGFTSYEAISRTKEGKNIDIECNTAMIRDDEGNYIAGVSIVRDISERKRMEQQHMGFEKLEELAGGIAHEFNNVLAAILGRTQLLRKGLEYPNEDQEKRESIHAQGLELIEEAALNGAQKIRQIQKLYRKRSERDDDTYVTEVDINKVITDAIEFTKRRWKDEAESTGIKIDIERELLPVPSVYGSVSQLKEAITHIINNAVEAMPHGGDIRVLTQAKDDTVSITIEDRGTGIPEQIKDRIFEPFFTTKGPHSAGLGMSVSYGIINRHRGTITVDSVEGKGTTFTIHLPALEKREHREREDGGEAVIGESKKVKILVIDDEDKVRELLCDILVGSGHEVEIARNGREGIELFKKKEFDLVFTDLGMPEMSGWKVAKEIKMINKNTPVALITGWNVQFQQSEMEENGVDLIVNKPFQLDQVLRLVQEGIELREWFKTS